MIFGRQSTGISRLAQRSPYFVWTTISERHWVHAGFPFRYWTPFDDKTAPHTDLEEENDKLTWGLQQILSLTFHNNNALIKRRPRIRILQLVPVIQRTHNLVRFALVMVVHGPEDHILSSIFKLLRKLPRLEALEINLPCRNRQVPIKHHFQLLSRLKELKIAGGWYRGAETMGPVPDNILPWKLQHLTSDRLDMFFFPYCLNLERLSFTTSGLSFGVPENTSFKQKVVEQLQQLVKLETIIFEENSYYPEFEYKIQRTEGPEKNRWALTSDTIAKTYSLDMLLNMI